MCSDECCPPVTDTPRPDETEREAADQLAREGQEMRLDEEGPGAKFKDWPENLPREDLVRLLRGYANECRHVEQNIAAAFPDQYPLGDGEYVPRNQRVVIDESADDMSLMAAEAITALRADRDQWKESARRWEWRNKQTITEYQAALEKIGEQYAELSTLRGGRVSGATGVSHGPALRRAQATGWGTYLDATAGAAPGGRDLVDDVVKEAVEAYAALRFGPTPPSISPVPEQGREEGVREVSLAEARRIAKTVMEENEARRRSALLDEMVSYAGELGLYEATAEPVDTRPETCALCGHTMTLDRCGSAGATLPAGTPISLCHADDHDCYYQWTLVRALRSES